MSYNGWENYETWNVALWFGNDEGLYHAARDEQERLEKLGLKFNGKTARRFVEEVMPNGTPDFQRMPPRRAKGKACYNKVHWPSIARAFNEY